MIFFKKKNKLQFLCVSKLISFGYCMGYCTVLEICGYNAINEMTGFTGSVDFFLSSKNIVLHPDFLLRFYELLFCKSAFCIEALS
jgi:hypothetical protein